MSRILHRGRAVSAALGLLTVLCLGTFAARVAYPFLTGQGVVNIRGASMEPTIPFGALAYVEPVEHPKVGEVVTFSINGTLVTHRIVDSWSGLPEGPWLTQGDANAAPDAGAVQSDQIVGRVTGWLPWVGLVAAVLTTPPVMAFVLLLALALLVWPSLMRPTLAPLGEGKVKPCSG